MTRVYEASKRVSEASKPTRGYLSVSVGVADESSIPDQSVFERYADETQTTGPGNSRSQNDSNIFAPSTITRPPSPLFSSLALLPSARIHVPSKLLARGEILPAQVQQYRRLAFALQELQDRSQWPGHSTVERGLKTVLVTSALRREGKTLTVVNVAHALSHFLGRRVLVIDADLYNPSVHEMLGLPNSVGLSDFLSGAQDVPLMQVSPLMSVLPAGQGDPARTGELTSDRMRALLDQCSARFDWVLLDAPAVGLLRHPEQLSRLVRSILLVIGSGSTPVRVIDEAISELGRGSIIGTVLNRVNGDR